MAKSAIYEVLHCGVASRLQFLLLTYVTKFLTVCSRTPLIRLIPSEKDINFTDRTIKESLKILVLCVSLFSFHRVEENNNNILNVSWDFY